MILYASKCFSPAFYTAIIITDYYDFVRVTGLPPQSSSSSFGASRLLSLPRLHMDVSLGFLGRVRRAALFLSTTLSDASLRPSPALSSLRGLSLKSLQLAHLAGKESFGRLLAFDPADTNQKSPASSSDFFANKNI